MNASDILKYGHKAVHDAIDTLPEGAWTTSGVCGLWSCKDIMAHLASYEQVLAELLASFTDAGPTPTLLRMRLDFGAFNDDEVAARAENTPRPRPRITITPSHTSKRGAALPAVSQRQPANVPSTNKV